MGTAVTDISLAINRYTGQDSGEETTFIEVTLWGRQAETAGKYLSKGRQAYIEGRLQLDSWEDKQSGQKRTKLKVVGENIQFLGGPGGGNSGGQAAPAQSRPQQQAQGGGSPAPMDSFDDDDDDIPF